MELENLVRRLAELRADDGFLTPEEAEALVAEGYEASLAQAAAALIHPDDFASLEDRARVFELLEIDQELLDRDSEPFLVKLRKWLLERGRQLVQRERTLQVLDLEIGRFAGLGVTLRGRLLDSGDPLISGDEERRSQGIAQPALRWSLLGGGVALKAGTQAPIQTASVGFEARAMLGFTLLYPLLGGLRSVDDALVASVIRLPLSSGNARDLPLGAECILRGRGSLCVSASMALASPVEWLPAIAVSAGSVKVFAPAEMIVRVKRLEASKVCVSLSTLMNRGVEASLGMQIGSTSEARAELAKLGGARVGRAGDLLEWVLDEQLETWLSVDLRRVMRVTRAEAGLSSYVFDLANARAGHAFDQLMGLDSSVADELAAEGVAVWSATLRERIKTAEESLAFRFSKLDLIRAVSSATQGEGQFSLSSGRQLQYSRVKLDDRSSGLPALGFGERSLSRELVQYRINGEPEDLFYRFAYTAHARWQTREDDLYGLLGLCELIGLLPDARKWVDEHRSVLPALSKIDRIVDVFISQAGLMRVADASHSKRHRAYGAAYEVIQSAADGIERATSPWLDPDDTKRQQARQLLRKFPHRAAHSREYRALSSGRELLRDAYAYREAQMLVDLFDKIADAPDAEARSNVVYEASSLLKLPFYRELGMICVLAGRSEIVVQRIELRSERAKLSLVLADEDAPQDIGDETQRLMRRPDRG